MKLAGYRFTSSIDQGDAWVNAVSPRTTEPAYAHRQCAWNYEVLSSNETETLDKIPVADGNKHTCIFCKRLLSDPACFSFQKHGNIYVDTLWHTTPSARWPYKTACHLLAEYEHDLHEIAYRLGLKRTWFQDHVNPKHQHYDLTASMRRKAIRMGAQPITAQELGRWLRGF